MRKVLPTTISLFILFSATAFSQAPQKLNYQAVARDAFGAVLQNRTVSVRFSVHTLSPTGPIVYVEVLKCPTNEFGLFSTFIGTGEQREGSFSEIDWSSGKKFLQVDFDPDGGEDFSVAGITELVSVPYAMYAERAKTVDNISESIKFQGTENFLVKFNADSNVTDSRITDDGHYIGVNIANPQSDLHLHNARGTAMMRLTTSTSGTEFTDGLTYGLNAGNDALFWNFERGSMIFGTNNKLNLAITNEGYFGFGKAAVSPEYNMDVSFQQDATLHILGQGSDANSSRLLLDRLNAYNDNATLSFANEGQELWQVGNLRSNDLRIRNAALAKDALVIDASTNRVGIGVSEPSAELEVNGQVKITGGKPGKGKVLTSDETGLASWSDGVPKISFNAVANVGSTPVPANTYSTVPFRFSTHDDGNQFSPLASAFKPESDGVYHIDVRVLWESFSAKGEVVLALRVNGTLAEQSVMQVSANNGAQQQTLSTNIKLNAGDVVSVAVRQSSRSLQYASFTQQENVFSGYKIY